MNKTKINFDLSYSIKDVVGKNGISRADLKKLEANLKKSNKKLQQDFQQEYLTFLRLPDQSKELLSIQYLAEKTRDEFENLIVIGIGGSDLGSRAAISALKSKHHNELYKEQRSGMKVYFAGDTTDIQPLKEIAEACDLSKTAIQVISKSGDTIETMTAFLYLKELLIKKVGIVNHRDHIIITTTVNKGALYQLAIDNDYTVLPHPSVGGRFSVLSSVGLFAMACAGIKIDELLRGAKNLQGLIKVNNLNSNPAFAFAAANYLAYKKNKQHILVLMPYVYKLAEFGKWFRQLWAESLGKNGQGQTPVAALGPTDQHSQLQLYQQGPADKIITFIKIAKHDETVVPQSKLDSVNYFSGHKYSNILEQELEATALGLVQVKRPSNTIIVPELNAHYLGQLFFFFELATVYSADLFNINAFDQPGVELSKQYLHAELGNPNLKDIKKKLTILKKSIKRYTI